MNSKFILLSVVFLRMLVLNVLAQEVIINGDGERLLVWDDFKGKPDKSSDYFAMTYWNLDYSFPKIVMNGGNISPKSLVLTLKFNEKKSWLKNGKATDELLKHEQGHFDLARLCQLEILATIKTLTLTTSNVSAKVQQIFDTTYRKYQILDLKYDEETKHSQEKTKQHEWNDFLLEEKQRLLKLNE